MVSKSKADIQREYAKKTDYAAQKKYNAENLKRLNVQFNINTDEDIIAKLDSVDNKAAYIKQLIRNDILKEKL